VDNFRIKMKQTISERTKKPFSGSTINKLVSLAWRIYYLGMVQGIVKSNPFARRGAFKEEPKGQYIPEKEFWMMYKFLPEYPTRYSCGISDWNAMRGNNRTGMG